MRKLTSALLAVGLIAACVWAVHGMAFAQDRPGGERRRGGGGQWGGGQWDPARMTEMIMGRMKENLAPTDEEWKVIEPRLGAVIEKQTELRRSGLSGGGRGWGRGRGGGRGGPGGGQGADPAVSALRETLGSEDAKKGDIKAKLKALRKARKKAEGDLQQVREELRPLLTIRQEAQLVLTGILD